MAISGSGKWERLGAALVKCAGTNMSKVLDGIDAAIAVDPQSGPQQPTAAKPRQSRKTKAAAVTAS